MTVVAICIASFALGISAYTFGAFLGFKEDVAAMVANLALEVAKLPKHEEPDDGKKPAGEVFEEGINNMLSYTLKGYGLNTDFLNKDGDTDG